MVETPTREENNGAKAPWVVRAQTSRAPFGILLPVIRFIGFFVAVLLATSVLAQVPYIGAVFQIPFLGFWFTAILLSVVFAKLGSHALDAGRRRALERSLGSIDTPHHKGKLGVLLLNQGRVRKAVPLLEAASAGDPESLEWRYRLAQGQARQRGQEEHALGSLEHVLAADEEHGFGDSMLLSAELHARAGRDEEALSRVERFERNHGPSPQSSLMRGRILKAVGRSEEAGAAFTEVTRLARSMPRYSGSTSLSWTLRAWWARTFR